MEQIFEIAGRTLLSFILSVAAVFHIGQPSATTILPDLPTAAPITITVATVENTATTTGTAAATSTSTSTTTTTTRTTETRVVQEIPVAPKPVVPPKPPVVPKPPTITPPLSPAPKLPPPPLPPSPPPMVSPVPQTTATTSASSTSLSKPLTFDDINLQTRAALVNILCITQSAGPVSPITGSGVIIDPRGVILTNAHIAQYVLLKDLSAKDFIQCTIRVGSPARPAYKVVPLYISPRWVNHNTDNIKRQEALGTGEDDFAMLLIDQAVGADQKLPESFPFVPVDALEQDFTGQPVLVAGYPAGFLGGEEIQRNLYAISAIATVKEMLSYDGETLDYLNISGNATAQRGSSGGAIVNSKGALVGIIGTVSSASQTDQRELGGIGLSHINESLLKQSGSDISAFLNENLSEKAAQFNSLIAPALITTLTKSVTTDTPAKY